MDLLERFKLYLLRPEKKKSKVTVKNYLVDLRKFILWFEKIYEIKFHPSLVNQSTLAEFKESIGKTSSASSVERYLSSLRKFYSFLKEQSIVTTTPFDSTQIITKYNNDIWHLNEFKNYLYYQSASRLTIKNYFIDIKQFTKWIEVVTTTTSPRITLDSSILENYKKYLSELKSFSPLSINRKLSALRKYIAWASQKGYVNTISDFGNITNIPKRDSSRSNDHIVLPLDENYLRGLNSLQEQKTETKVKRYSSFPPIRLIQKLLRIYNFVLEYIVVAPVARSAIIYTHLFWLLRGKPIFFKTPIPQRFGFHDTRKFIPKLFKRYQNNAFAYYFNIIVLTVLVSSIAFGLYTKFILEPHIKTQALAALPTAPPRILSFQGRLTDSSDNPITSRTDLRFAIYNDLSATGAALLWQENLSVSPDTDGIFSTQLGNNTTIPSTLFSQNASLYLGVTVGQTPELTPRQQLATVAYATNSETLQGLPPITAGSAGTTNVVLALDSSGNLTIGGSANPTFQASGGQFKLSGQPLVLTTNSGSNGNVQLSPDGLGKIDIQRPLTNTTTNNNIPSAAGAVEVDSLLAVLATSSGQSAFTINQTSTGPLISASASGIAKFTVGNDGSGYFAGNLGIGTTTPGYTLVAAGANGNISLDTLGSNPVLRLSRNGTNSIAADLASGNLSFYTGGLSTVRQYISPTGNIGIGPNNSTPLSTFDVRANSGTTSVASISGATSFAGLVVDNSGVGDLFTASSSGKNRFVITQGGNVGIGNTNPNNFPLQVNGSIGPNSSYAYNLGSNTAYWNTIFSKWVDTGPTGGLAVGLDSINVGNGTQPVATFSANTSFAAMVVDNSGVGDLFTASSSGLSRFTVMQSGNILIGDAARIGFTGSTPVDSFNYALYGSLSGNETAINGPNSSGVVTFKINNSEKMRLNSSGNLGIGTNNPGASLDLNTGTIQGAGLSSDCSGTSSKLLWSSSSKQFSCGTDKPNVMVIKSANQTVNSSTSLVNDTDLKFSVSANDTWIMHMVMGLSTNTTAGWKADFTAPTGTTCSYGFQNSSGSNSNNGCGSTVNQSQAPQITNFDGSFSVGASAGTIQFQWAQQTATAVNTIVQGSQSYLLAYKTTGADYAETYYTKDTSISPGTVVSIDGSLTAGFKKSQGSYDKGLMGVVSSKPGNIIGDYQSQGEPMPIALDGRVPVRVNLENGPIKAGDYLTSSSMPGVAMKATQAGEVIGKALTDYDGFAGAEGEVVLYLQRGWADPNVTITDTGLLHLSPIDRVSDSTSLSAKYSLSDAQGNLIKKIDAFSQAIIASLQAGAFDAQTAVINTFNATTAHIINLTADKIISPVSEIDTLHTKIISPLGEDGQIAISVNTDNIEVKNGASGSAVARIDNQGNQLLSGNLQVNKDATISGTLHAGKIYADEIVGLSTASGSSTITNNITNIYESSPSAFQSPRSAISPSSAPTLTPTPSPVASDSAIATASALLHQLTKTETNTSFTDLASYSGYLSYVPHLNEANFGATGPDVSQVQALPDLAVSGTLSVGSRLVLADNTINVLGEDLQLQPLGQGGVSIADGNVYIDSNGNLTVKGDATFTGNLAANIISPLADHNLTISLNNKNATNSANAIQPQLNVDNASGSGVFAINQLGDIIASGAATISKLNLQVAPEALAVSNTEQVASGSAGTASIRANQTEITIDNAQVTDHSLIYITPVGPTEGNGPYLLRQITGKSFSVGIQVPNIQDTVFNWLIIN